MRTLPTDLPIYMSSKGLVCGPRRSRLKGEGQPMTTTILGGCACGAVRYSGQAFDAVPFRCYCRDCQRATGTGHADMMPLDKASFSVKGDLREFQLTGGSGKPTWSTFCPECGSPITRRSARMSDRLYVHAGSLDDPTLYAPGKEIYTDSAPHWDRE